MGLLEARASAEPDRLAVTVDGRGTLTFADWERRASSVAYGLRETGLRPGDRVGLLFADEDWIDYAVAFCAVHMAGGVAVPVLHELGRSRSTELFVACQASHVLHGEKVTGGEWETAVTSTPRDLDDGMLHTIDVDVRPDELAQIIYTSGSTGRPKGVAATHGNLVFGLNPAPRRRPLSHSRHFLHAFPIGTNAGQHMLINMLAAAPTALTLPEFDAETFGRLIEAYAVGTVFVVPAMAIELLNARVHERYDLSSVVLFGSSGAALPPSVGLALAHAFPSAAIVNYYTSTEAAPAQLTMVFDPDRPDAVGRADRQSDLQIVADAGQPLGAGHVGEVKLRAPAAPRWYVDDPAGSAEVFADGWARMGDLGYLDDDGYLHLVDRKDDTIKSGGFKVSTLGVEAVLHEHSAVVDAAVVGTSHPVMGTMVAAAVVLDAEVSLDELRAYLKGRLGRHEVPTQMLAVDSLPRNALGKVVKRDVRGLFEAALEAPKSPPTTATELALARLWERVLSVPGIAAEDDFFALGGDSLRASQLVTLVSDQLGADMTTSVVFDVPVLAEQARWIDAAERVGTTATSLSSVEGADRADGASLSAQQEDFLRWTYETAPPRDPGSICIAIRIKDEFDMAVFRRSLVEVLRRHEALSTVFVPADERTAAPHPAAVPTARANDEIAPEVAEVSIERDPIAEREGHAADLAAQERNQLTSITRPPLLRALVIHVAADDHVLVLGVHHVVFDGWSMTILLRELGQTYSALRAGHAVPLAPLPLSYTDYCRWTRDQWPRTRPFWERTLAGAPAALTPFPGRAETRRHARRQYDFDLGRDVSTGLRELTRANDASTFVGVAACWSAVLAQWTGRTDIVLMTAVPGRTRPEHETLIGCLVQSLLMRVDATGDPSFLELLARVRSSAFAAVDHQFYPYADFRTRVPYSARLYYEAWDGPAHFPGLLSGPFALPRLQALDWATPAGEVDLSVPELDIDEQPDGTLVSSVIYNRHAFNEPTVARLAEVFTRFCERALARPELQLSDLGEGQ